MERQWVQVRRDLHQIPEIGYQEYKTQGYLESMINRLPQEHLSCRKVENRIVCFSERY